MKSYRQSLGVEGWVVEGLGGIVAGIVEGMLEGMFECMGL